MNSEITPERWKEIRARAIAVLYDSGNKVGRDVDFIQNPETGRFEGSRPQGGGEGSGAGGRAGARSGEQAQSRAEKAAAGHAKLVGLPDKPLKVGDSWYVPGPYGKAKEAATRYMQSAGLPYDPPKQFLKVDKERAARVAAEYDSMKHAPDDPKVRASYEALAKETLAQWQEIKKTGLKVEWIKPGADDPYATTPRLGAMDVTENNHWWGFPTDAGYGSGDPETEANLASNPMLQMTDEVVDGRRLMVNDVFRIVHDYFGHFKEGVGFRADGEENAWRSHAAMYSELARGAMTSETRGQNSWVNYGPHGEKNRTASAADTIYAPQKIGLMPEWTWNEARGDPAKSWHQLRARAEALLARGQFIQDPVTGLMDGSLPGPGHGEGTGTGPSEKPGGARKAKKTAKLSDFEKEKIPVLGSDPEKFIERWNEVVGEDPGEFKQKFLGGLTGSMMISYEKYRDQISLNGNLYHDEKTLQQLPEHERASAKVGDNYGNYTRHVDLDDHKAQSGYLHLNEEMQGKGIGKDLLKGNVDVYQEMGIESVDVHANIDVGGHAWARYGYIPTQASWNRDLQPMLRSKLAALGGGGGSGEGGEATSWEELTESAQEEAKEKWMSDSYNEFYDNEVESWRESGRPLNDAKTELAESYHLVVHGSGNWATNAMAQWRKETDYPDTPFSDEQILEAINISYHDKYDEGRADPEIEFDDEKLDAAIQLEPALPGMEQKPHELLTQDMRDEIEKALTRAFNDKAESDAADIEPPEYLAESAREHMDEYWDQIEDRERFRIADNFGLAETGGFPREDIDIGEIEPSELDELRHLINSNDPKALWAISDSKWGKKLLLDSDWNGKLDLTDKDTMERFRAYTANKKKTAPPPEYWRFD